MKIDGLSYKQIEIADLLWECQTKEDVDRVVAIYGHDAVVVKQMIIAQAIDDKTADKEAFPYAATLIAECIRKHDDLQK